MKTFIFRGFLITMFDIVWLPEGIAISQFLLDASVLLLQRESFLGGRWRCTTMCPQVIPVPQVTVERHTSKFLLIPYIENKKT